MEQEQILRARIASLTELRGLFQALRALAASRLQEALAALPGIRAYSDIVAEALADALALGGTGVRSTGRRAAMVVVCSEHGFAGGFNARLLDEAAARLRPGQDLIVIGKRGGVTAAERKLTPDLVLPTATHIAGVGDAAHDVALALSGHAEAGVVFGRYRKGGGFDPAYRRVLPPDPPAPGGPRRAPPLVQLPAPALLAELDREYLFAALSQTLMESFASENAARLRVMEAADRAIGDKLEALARAENDLRQETITAELLDVVTGWDAVTR